MPWNEGWGAAPRSATLRLALECVGGAIFHWLLLASKGGQVETLGIVWLNLREVVFARAAQGVVMSESNK